MHMLIMTLLVWPITFFLAIFPLLHQVQFIFVDKAFIYKNPFFNNTLVSMDSAKKWISTLMTFDNQFANVSDDIFDVINEAQSWFVLEDVVNRSSLSGPYFRPRQFLG